MSVFDDDVLLEDSEEKQDEDYPEDTASKHDEVKNRRKQVCHNDGINVYH